MNKLAAQDSSRSHCEQAEQEKLIVSGQRQPCHKARQGRAGQGRAGQGRAGQGKCKRKTKIRQGQAHLKHL